jgi:lysyl-tRNA synthetase class I
MKSQLINMDDFEGLQFPSVDAKRVYMDKMFADKINEMLQRLDAIEEALGQIGGVV